MINELKLNVKLFSAKNVSSRLSAVPVPYLGTCSLVIINLKFSSVDLHVPRYEYRTVALD